jgi:hypothetical protein
MKKIPQHLTGIVFLIAILVAGACSSGNRPTGEDTITNEPEEKVEDSNKVTVFFRDTMMDGRMHLLMSDSNNRDSVVVDSLLTKVNRGTTIFWKKDSKDIIQVLHIRPVGDSGRIFTEDATLDSLRGVHKYTVPVNAPIDTTEKYEIVFTVKREKDKKPTTWCIDPYLRVPIE